MACSPAYGQASVTVNLVVPIRCEISLRPVVGFDPVSSPELGELEGACNAPHSLTIETPDLTDFVGMFSYENATQPFQSGITRFARIEGARVYRTPLMLAGSALSTEQLQQLTTVRVQPGL
jgi:hypothetical protein